MLRLNLTNAPRWIDLAPGVRVEVLPMGTGLIGRAQVDLRKARDDADESPIDRPAFAKAIARHAIIAWEGVGDENGAPLEVSPNGIAALLECYPLYLAFERAYTNPGLILADEGNVFAPLPNGTSVGARPIATNASVVVPTAPIKKTPRARSKAPKSGT